MALIIKSNIRKIALERKVKDILIERIKRAKLNGRRTLQDREL
jgi:hypothetical protein